MQRWCPSRGGTQSRRVARTRHLAALLRVLRGGHLLLVVALGGVALRNRLREDKRSPTFGISVGISVVRKQAVPRRLWPIPVASALQGSPHLSVPALRGGRVVAAADAADAAAAVSGLGLSRGVAGVATAAISSLLRWSRVPRLLRGSAIPRLAARTGATAAIVVLARCIVPCLGRRSIVGLPTCSVNNRKVRTDP